MSVFTPVDAEQCAAWLERYELGTLSAIVPIPEGIQNTNYFVTTDKGRYVLTLYERIGQAELRFYLRLLTHLADHGIPCPTPVTANDGEPLGTLNGKPAAIMSHLPGRSLSTPDPRHCAALGTLLARLHLAAEACPERIDNPRGMRWCRETGAQLLPALPADEQTLLQDELRFQALFRLEDLPRGIVHGDVFRDNVLFDTETPGHAPRISGIIDFYFAGADSLLFDLAVAANDWCLGADEDLARDRTGALLQAYHRVRPMTAIERGAWPVLLRRTALRFWLSRLRDWHARATGAMTFTKDPAAFRDILRRHIVAGSDRPWL
ncbi:MAG: homoserine kinase [Rhodocyclaceae bacterium]